MNVVEGVLPFLLLVTELEFGTCQVDDRSVVLEVANQQQGSYSGHEARSRRASAVIHSTPKKFLKSRSMRMKRLSQIETRVDL